MSPREMTLDRREFLQGLAAGGLLLTVSAAGCRRMDRALRGEAEAEDPREGFTPVAYVRLDDAGGVTVICHRSEMGQGIRTSLAMVLADELEADWSRVAVEQAPGDEKTYGSQDTDGSQSIRGFLLPFRRAGAVARALLERAAAKQWGVPAGEATARFHEVVHQPTGRTLPFGQLVAIAKDLPVPDAATLPLKPASAFRYVGKEIPIVDLFDMTTGRARYGFDQALPGMKVAVIARPPVWGAGIASVDSTAAERVAGVERIVRLPVADPPSGFTPLGGVAVVARDTWSALEGRRQLRITWASHPNEAYDSGQYRRELERAAGQPGKVARRQGDVTAALARATRRLSADYYIPHLAHAMMEPPAALAWVTADGCEIWAPTQGPQLARDMAAKALGIPVERVTVHVTLLGGGFGRKSKPDYSTEAALLSREVEAPVKVVWTRDDDLQHDYYHTVAAEHLEGGLDGAGRVTAWLHRSALPSISATFAPKVRYQSDGEMNQGLVDLPFDIPNLQAEAGPATSHTRIGWYRSVINIPHAFAVGSFVDELAHAAGKDPRDFLLALLGPDRLVDLGAAGLTVKPQNYGESFTEYPIDIARFKRVIRLAADSAGWGGRLPAGRGRGIAVHRSFVTYVAAVVEVEVGSDGSVRVPRVDIAADPGFVVHPERVRAQLEGAVIMGLGNALLGEITFQQGRAVQANYDTYQVARMDAAPREIRVRLAPAGDAPPGGVGEPGVPPIAPALCNAIFAATGHRVRALPVARERAALARARAT